MPIKINLCCLVLTLVTFHLQAQDVTTLKAIKAGKLIDVVNQQVIDNPVVLIRGDRIEAVGKELKIPKNAQIIDLGQATLLPGLIDCHTHIISDPGENYYEDIFRKSTVDYAVAAHIYAKRTLEAGFTMCRDVGGFGYIDVSLRNAINAGTIPGPRLLVATYIIGATGGHADLNGFSPDLSRGANPYEEGIADGVDEIRKRVRENVKYGADLIKFTATAGVLSEEESVGAAQYSLEEMKALVEEAHRWDKKVAAHAHGAEGIKLAVEAGVNSIEHGSLIDEEGIQMMIEHGTWLVSDIYNDDYIVSEYSKLGYPEKIIEKEKLVGKTQRENFQKAAKAGVKIAFGTDAGVYPHGWNAKQFYYMVKYGLTPMQAIRAATLDAADLLGWKDKTGSVEKGKLADIIAIQGDPLQDITLLEKVGFVMKDGQVFKNNLP